MEPLARSGGRVSRRLRPSGPHRSRVQHVLMSGMANSLCADHMPITGQPQVQVQGASQPASRKMLWLCRSPVWTQKMPICPSTLVGGSANRAHWTSRGRNSNASRHEVGRKGIARGGLGVQSGGSTEGGPSTPGGLGCDLSRECSGRRLREVTRPRRARPHRLGPPESLPEPPPHVWA